MPAARPRLRRGLPVRRQAAPRARLPPSFHPTTLVRFRARLARNGGARLALDAALEAMRGDGFLKCRAVRIDSTHLLASISDMSRLECVRETLRLAPGFLSAFGGGESWEPWFSRHAERNPAELRDAPANTLAARMGTAGADMRDLLARADALGAAVAAAGPAATLRRVFGEQFEEREGAAPAQRRASLPGAAASPHDPDAQWSTKKSLGKTGWKGCKAHVCETVHDGPRLKGEPTRSAITATHVVPATASDHGAAAPVPALHAGATGSPPAEALADAGHISAPALPAADAAGYELAGPAPPHSAARFGTDASGADIPARSATCPAGHASSGCSRVADARHGVKHWFAWPAALCAACGLRGSCLPKKGTPTRRSIEVGEHHMTVQARRNLCKTEEYRVRMRRSNAIGGTHSELARGCGFRHCRYRGLPKTQLQAHFTAAACNVRRWARRVCWEERQNG